MTYVSVMSQLYLHLADTFIQCEPKQQQQQKQQQWVQTVAVGSVVFLYSSQALNTQTSI